MIKRAYVASAYTNRGGCVRRRCLDRCPHNHRTFGAALRCKERHQREEARPRSWRVDTIVWWVAT